MTLELIRSTLAWCTVINMGLLVWWFLAFTLAHDLTHRLHGRWYKLSAEQFDAIHYKGIMYFKGGIFLLNLVPYLALRIVG